MAEPLRIEYEGAVYHVTARGNARNKIFADDRDREIFLAILGIVVKRYNWLCHAYCLMDNHYHVLIETPVPGCKVSIHAGFVSSVSPEKRYYNTRNTAPSVLPCPVHESSW